MTYWYDGGPFWQNRSIFAILPWLAIAGESISGRTDCGAEEKPLPRTCTYCSSEQVKNSLSIYLQMLVSAARGYSYQFWYTRFDIPARFCQLSTFLPGSASVLHSCQVLPAFCIPARFCQLSTFLPGSASFLLFLPGSASFLLFLPGSASFLHSCQVLPASYYSCQVLPASYYSCQVLPAFYIPARFCQLLTISARFCQLSTFLPGSASFLHSCQVPASFLRSCQLSTFLPAFYVPASLCYIPTSFYQVSTSLAYS